MLNRDENICGHQVISPTVTTHMLGYRHHGAFRCARGERTTVVRVGENDIERDYLQDRNRIGQLQSGEQSDRIRQRAHE
jgi:hypothetical protein